MENFQGKLRGEGPPKRVRIVWTAGWVEPGDKGTMVTILGLWPCGHNPRMVTIIPLSPGSTQPAVHTIRTRLGGPSPRSFEHFS